MPILEQIRARGPHRVRHRLGTNPMVMVAEHRDHAVACGEAREQLGQPVELPPPVANEVPSQDHQIRRERR